MKMSQELKVGVFGIISLLILYFGGLFMRGQEIFSTNNNYYSYITNVDGLLEGQKIRLNGANVGIIKKIEFLPEKKYQSKVTFSIDKRIRLNKNSYLDSESLLMGGKFLKLHIEDGEEINNGDEIIFNKNDNTISNITNQASPIVSNIQELVKNLNVFVVSMNANNEKIKMTIQNLENATRALQNTIIAISPKISNVIDTINDENHGLDATLLELHGIGKKINNLKLEETVDNLNECIKKIKETPIWDNTNNTILQTQNAIKDLDKLFIDIRLHPYNYVNFSLWGNKKKSNIKNRS